MTSFNDIGYGFLLILKHEGIFKRGKIIEEADEGEVEHSIYLVDYGTIVKADFSSFYTCSGGEQNNALQYVFELPPQCFQCFLSEICPSPINCPSGWSVRSTEEFKKFIEGKSLEIEVLSFVDRIASVRLIAGGFQESFNDYLVVSLELALPCDDSYMCLLDQNDREKQRFRGRDSNEVKLKLEDELADDSIVPPPGDKLKEEIMIEGPFSPLESQLKSLCQSGTSHTSIEASSVNHVLFDPYPNDGVKKLLVSASMSQRDQRVTLHQTTIMPHLPGMACLLSLIFSPIAEVRCTKRRDRYSSILTGLGCDENRKPHFGEHDCLFFTDVELDQKDFDMINLLRKKMSSLMQSEPNSQFQSLKGFEKSNARTEIGNLLKDIMTKDRSPLGILEENEWEWKPFVKIEQKSEAMYPTLVTWEKLMPMSENTRRTFKNGAQELKRQADTNSKDQIIHCALCEEKIETVIDLKLHVMKKLHQKRLERIRDETS